MPLKPSTRAILTGLGYTFIYNDLLQRIEARRPDNSVGLPNRVFSY